MQPPTSMDLNVVDPRLAAGRGEEYRAGALRDRQAALLALEAAEGDGDFRCGSTPVGCCDCFCSSHVAVLTGWYSSMALRCTEWWRVPWQTRLPPTAADPELAAVLWSCRLPLSHRYEENVDLESTEVGLCVI